VSTVLGFCPKGHPPWSFVFDTHFSRVDDGICRVDVIVFQAPLYPHRTLWRYTNVVLLLLLLSWSRSLTATPSRTWPFVRVPTDAGKSWKMTVMESQGKVEFHQCVMEFLTATAVNDGRLDVYRATVEGKLLYAAWSGFCSAGDRVRLNSYSY